MYSDPKRKPNEPALTEIERLVEREVHRAMDLHPPMNSPHEAYAVILEELDEFWLEVKAQPHSVRKQNLREELIQVAAMAVRALHDLQLLEDS